MNPPSDRFSDRVDNYFKCRPTYPPEVIEFLESECGLSAASRVVDIGSGTGILTKLLLDRGYEVTGVEPNAEMRSAAERLLKGSPRFISAAGSAEASGLKDNSVDLIVAGQAFHWFDPKESKREFLRILKPGGSVALIWNERKAGGSPFHADYEALLIAHATDHDRAANRRVGNTEVGAFFDPHPFREKSYTNNQQLDFEGLKGRCLSSPYAPNEGSPGFDAVMSALRRTFDRHAVDGFVAFQYIARVYYGQFYVPASG